MSALRQKPDGLGTADLRQIFGSTRRPDNPTRVALPEGSETWPRALRDDLASDLKPAGVLIPVIQRRTELTVLLTRRSDELTHHAGQVSFPGGRMEAGDEDIVATALRETHEEVGIEPRRVSIIGFLEPTPTITGYAVTPTIGIIEDLPQLRLDPGEVSAAFEVPLDYLLDKRNYRREFREFRGQRLPVIEVSFEGQRIWGATAFMMSEFIKYIENGS